MDNTVYKKLTEKERAQLAAFADSETFRTVVKALDIYQKVKAVNTIASSPDHETTVLNRGEIQGARFLADLALHSKKSLSKRKSS